MAGHSPSGCSGRAEFLVPSITSSDPGPDAVKWPQTITLRRRKKRRDKFHRTVVLPHTQYVHLFLSGPVSTSSGLSHLKNEHSDLASALDCDRERQIKYVADLLSVPRSQVYIFCFVSLLVLLNLTVRFHVNVPMFIPLNNVVHYGEQEAPEALTHSSNQSLLLMRSQLAISKVSLAYS